MRFSSTLTIIILPAAMMTAATHAEDGVKVANGLVAGTTEPDGVRAFRGIPFAEPPVGELRWKPPQPVRDWEGVRLADKFGPRAMQRPIFSDMNFRSDGVSEDCLYLNVWTPARSGDERLPVLVYFFGGGFVAGDGSEYRYDGASMARQGIVVVTVTYRLGVFGFLAHPELTRESPHHASGNYGLLDQAAALLWVRRNIAAFGGDPAKVTIAGESAGSLSVSAQMASPLAKGLIAGAIAESGSILGTMTPVPLAEAEKVGVRFAEKVGAKSLDDLRKLPADALLQATAESGYGHFPLCVDGDFLPRDPAEIFAAGEQAHVPLLVGWNSEENNYTSILGTEKPTRENFTKAVRKLYGDRAEDVLKLYQADTDAEVEQAATDLAGDRFIGFSTWRLAELHGRSSGQPVYRYFYTRPRPATRAELEKVSSDAKATTSSSPRGAVHSAEIEYAMGNLATNRVYAWTPEDEQVSRVMQGDFANFVKTGDPNGPGLPIWPATNQDDANPVMRIDVESRAVPDAHRARYLLLDRIDRKATD